MTWKYVDVLNAGLAILLNVAVGVVVGAFRLLPSHTHSTLNSAVFKVFLPLYVLQGIGLKTDLYEDDIWGFIGAFLVLRAVVLLIAGVTALRSWPVDWRAWPGRAVVDWVGYTWISTIILGVPVLRAAMGDEYAKYGILAGVSALVFQIPAVIVIFEMHVWLNEGRASRGAVEAGHESASTGAMASAGPALAAAQQDHLEAQVAGCGGLSVQSSGHVTPAAHPSTPPTMPGTPFSGRLSLAASSASLSTGTSPAPAVAPPASLAAQLRASFARLGALLLRNFVLWGIAAGFVLSLSRVGPRFLDPGPAPAVINGVAVADPNEEFVQSLGFINTWLTSLGQCVEPLTLFAMGFWASTRWRAFVQATPQGKEAALARDDTPAVRGTAERMCTPSVLLHWAKVGWMLLFKLVVCPLLMVGIARAFSLSNDAARAAVLVAAIPISLASFTLSEQYGIGEALLTKASVFGTVLLLPTVMVWLQVLDTTGTFSFTKGAVL